MKSKELSEILSGTGLEAKTQKPLEPAEFEVLFETLTKSRQIQNIEDYLDGVTYIPSKKKAEEPKKEKAAEPVAESVPVVESAKKEEAASTPAAPKAPEKKAEAPAPKAEVKKAPATPVAEPKTEAPAPAKAEAKVEAKAEAKAEAEAKAKVEPKAEPKPAPRAEQKPAPAVSAPKVGEQRAPEKKPFEQRRPEAPRTDAKPPYGNRPQYENRGDRPAAGQGNRFDRPAGQGQGYQPRPVNRAPQNAAAAAPVSAEQSFEDKLKQFLSSSEGKMADLNRSIDGKRGGGRRRR